MLLHSTTVAVDDKAAVLLGPSGSGKSTLALRMISLGAVLVSDDQTRFSVDDNCVIAHSIPAIEGMIEVRGMGVLNAPFQTVAIVSLVVDMATIEEERLPPTRSFEILGQKVNLYRKLNSDHFADALVHFLRYGSIN